MLTALAIEKLKPKEKPYKVLDGNQLSLLVSPSGAKHFRLRYHFYDKEKMLSLGAFPQVSLADARAKRDQALKLLADGIDPSDQKKQDTLVAAVARRNTFEAVANDYLERLAATGVTEGTVKRNRWLLLSLASPLAKRPIAKITPVEILVLLQKYEKAGLRVTAKRLRGIIGAVFRLAIATMRAPTDPTYALRGAIATPPVTHRAAITDERQLGVLLAQIDDYTGWPTLKAALQFLALTMARPIEVRHMRRNEVIWPSAIWRIPAQRMKMRRPHDVPLSNQALEVLRAVWPLTREDNLVFPSIRSWRRPLSENAFNSVLRRLGYGTDEMCAHGFRASASTILNERGYDPRVIEAALAHMDQNAVRRAYNRAQYWPERQRLLQDFADVLDGLKAQTSKVRSS